MISNKQKEIREERHPHLNPEVHGNKEKGGELDRTVQLPAPGVKAWQAEGTCPRSPSR